MHMTGDKKLSVTEDQTCVVFDQLIAAHCNYIPTVRQERKKRTQILSLPFYSWKEMIEYVKYKYNVTLTKHMVSKVRKRKYRNVQLAKNDGFQKCDDCRKLKQARDMATPNTYEAKRAHLLYMLHLERESQARIKFYKHNRKAQTRGTTHRPMHTVS